MISYTTYKILHLLSVFGLLALISYWLGQPKEQRPVRLAMGVIGGVGFLVLTGGMGLMARLGVGFAPWVLAKLGIWFVVLGASSILVKRWSGPAWKAVLLTWGLFSAAAFIAIQKF